MYLYQTNQHSMKLQSEQLIFVNKNWQRLRRVHSIISRGLCNRLSTRLSLGLILKAIGGMSEKTFSELYKALKQAPDFAYENEFQKVFSVHHSCDVCNEGVKSKQALNIDPRRDRQCIAWKQNLTWHYNALIIGNFVILNGQNRDELNYEIWAKCLEYYPFAKRF